MSAHVESRHNQSPLAWTTGYCTNVHAGTDLESIRNNLTRYASSVRSTLGHDVLNVGLWIPASAAKELQQEPEGFKSFLDEHHLRAYTINGFPHDNFHQNVVKHSVYRPTWWESERLDYTRSLATILASLLDEEREVGSISTLPLGWQANQAQDPTAIQTAGKNFRELSGFLKRIHQTTGKRIVVAIEPEPGCVLDTTDDIIRFFDTELAEATHRQYITVCHDVCHSAVMMEAQAEVLESLANASIMVGKVQVSSAIEVDWEAMAVGRQREAINQLRQFAEDRYLHQTGQTKSNRDFALAEDLPNLLENVSSDGEPVWGDKRWVVHFHVPIFLERFGHLTTTQDDILDCLRFLSDLDSNSPAFTGHLEIETYAWSVLPESMRKRGLAEDIAEEFKWLHRGIAEVI